MRPRSDKQPHEPRPSPFAVLPRCGAKTRAGLRCQQPASGKGRCYLHGGAQGSGAPQGNQNALKHGRYTAAAKAERRAVHALTRQAKAHLRTMRQ
jgi:uncharacterized protein YjcR